MSLFPIREDAENNKARVEPSYQVAKPGLELGPRVSRVCAATNSVYLSTGSGLLEWSPGKQSRPRSSKLCP